MKFLADMGISPKTVALLRALGHDATHLQEQGLERLPDPAIMTKAREEERILLTCDLGFGELVAASGARLPSVIIFRLRDMRPTHVNRHLSQLEKDDFGTHECFGTIHLPPTLRVLRRLPMPRKLGLLERLYGSRLAREEFAWVEASNGVVW
jgi:predicted nuclease of predicted toxin-antitoxin system